jgi:hypothetical protein
MERIFLYKMTTDNGGAPCVRRGILSLAICKPGIRNSAKEGDLIFGFAANSLHRDNRLIYVARVTGVQKDGWYYRRAKYSGRHDRIYKWEAGELRRRRNARFHGEMDLPRDVGKKPHKKAVVLLSEDFRYLGEEGTAEYKSTHSQIGHAVETLGQGYRVNLGGDLRSELLELKQEMWNRIEPGAVGSPTGRVRGKC